MHASKQNITIWEERKRHLKHLLRFNVESVIDSYELLDGVDEEHQQNILKLGEVLYQNAVMELRSIGQAPPPASDAKAIILNEKQTGEMMQLLDKWEMDLKAEQALNEATFILNQKKEN